MSFGILLSSKACSLARQDYLSSHRKMMNTSANSFVVDFFLQFFQLKVLLEPFIYLESIQSLLDVWNILYVITFMWKFTHEKPKVSDRYWLIFC